MTREARSARRIARKVIARCAEKAQRQTLRIHRRMRQPLEQLRRSAQTCPPISIAPITRRERGVNKPHGVD
jgi:hypothetical protein